MAGGSTTPEGDDDCQCVHCGLWYARLGVHQHESTCDLRDHNRRLVDLTDPEAVMRSDDVELSELDADADELEEADDRVVDEEPRDELPDAITDGDAVVFEPGDDADDPGAARTDGGPQAVPSGWSEASPAPSTAAGDDDDDSDEPTCPACGSPDWFDPDEIVDQFGGQLPDEVVDELREADRACEPCSTTDGGALAPSVEVYDV